MSAAAEPYRPGDAALRIGGSAIADLDVARQRLGADPRPAGLDRAQVEARAGSILAHALDLVGGEAPADVAAEGFDLGGEPARRGEMQRDVAAHAFDVDAPVTR